jgi:hypothetical protein
MLGIYISPRCSPCFTARQTITPLYPSYARRAGGGGREGILPISNRTSWNALNTSSSIFLSPSPSGVGRRNDHGSDNDQAGAGAVVVPVPNAGAGLVEPPKPPALLVLAEAPKPVVVGAEAVPNPEAGVRGWAV